jgi:hypothetical protein
VTQHEYDLHRQVSHLRADLEAAQANAHAQWERGEELAAGVRGFLGTLPYMAPEAVELQARIRLAEPLAEYERRG